MRSSKNVLGKIASEKNSSYLQKQSSSNIRNKVSEPSHSAQRSNRNSPQKASDAQSSGRPAGPPKFLDPGA